MTFLGEKTWDKNRGEVTCLRSHSAQTKRECQLQAAQHRPLCWAVLPGVLPRRCLALLSGQIGQAAVGEQHC